MGAATGWHTDARAGGRVMDRWPEDEIGKPIDPSKGERVPEWLKAA